MVPASIADRTSSSASKQESTCASTASLIAMMVAASIRTKPESVFHFVVNSGFSSALKCLDVLADRVCPVRFAERVEHRFDRRFLVGRPCHHGDPDPRVMFSACRITSLVGVNFRLRYSARRRQSETGKARAPSPARSLPRSAQPEDPLFQA
jgi:hypothetical protein